MSVTIERRFRGPPDSANGGYCCGLLAKHLDGAAEVTLRSPPPLDRNLAMEAAETVRLMDGETLVAEARPVDLDVAPPAPPGAGEAAIWSRSYPGFSNHAFPGCFVCGPERRAGDGLRIFAGPSPASDRVAAVWQPDETLAGKDGMIQPEFLWAALDCPGYFAVADGRVALLGRMHGVVHRRPSAGDDCVVIGWPVSREGRKLMAGTALFDDDAYLLAASLQTWIIPT